MASTYEDVVRVYGDEPRPHFNPQPLTVPRSSPSPNQIHDIRDLTGITQKQSADICAVTIETWKRWEGGKITMPRVTWGWYRIVTQGCVTAGGPEWEGWGFNNGRLYSPENWGGFTPGELRSWPYIHAQLDELKRCNRVLNDELIRARQEIPKRVIALGQIDVFGLIARQLINDFSQIDDPLLREFSERLHSAINDLSRIKPPRF